MKNLKNYLIYNQNTKSYITEKQNFLIKNKSVLKDYDHYEYHPETKEELEDIIIDLLKQGITDLNCIDVSNIDDMSRLFIEVSDDIKVKEIDISNWDVSNVTDMRSMFFNCKKFNSDISNWNVSKVKKMNYMFYQCHNFNSDLSEWDVSNVEYMNGMFGYCNKFNYDLSNWDVSNVTKMSNIFDGCDELEKNNKIPAWYTE